MQHNNYEALICENRSSHLFFSGEQHLCYELLLVKYNGPMSPLSTYRQGQGTLDKNRGKTDSHEDTGDELVRLVRANSFLVGQLQYVYEGSSAANIVARKVAIGCSKSC